MLLVFFIGREKLVSKEQLNHLIDLVMVHYVEKTYVENEFKLARVANLSIHVEENESLVKEGEFKPNEKQLQKNIVKGPEDLKKIVDEEASSIMDSNKIDI
jgi:phage-related baseplate assembly protein